MISERARRWSEHDPFLVTAHFTCVKDPYHPDANPGGYVNFGTAENRLVFDAAKPLLEAGLDIVESDAHYNELHGAGFLREAVADFLGRRAARPLSPEHIAVASGASAILEMLSFALCDPGDAILIPAPYYSGFDHDLALRSEARLVRVALASPEFRLTPGLLEEAFSRAESDGLNVRAVLLNSPQNPLGQVYGEELLTSALDFAQKRGIHVILDEIYAESLMPGVAHCTGLAFESPLVHVVYGFAKDFGLSGYKVGILHSGNEQVNRAVRDSAYFHTVSAQTQRMLAAFLRSPGLGAFFKTLRSGLASACEHASGILGSAGIATLPVEGGIVLWLDLSSYLKECTFDAEKALFTAVFDQCRVNISPGRAFHCSVPGWFRMCFTVPESDRAEGLKRILDYLETA